MTYLLKIILTIILIITLQGCNENDNADTGSSSLDTDSGKGAVEIEIICTDSGEFEDNSTTTEYPGWCEKIVDGDIYRAGYNSEGARLMVKKAIISYDNSSVDISERIYDSAGNLISYTLVYDDDDGVSGKFEYDDEGRMLVDHHVAIESTNTGTFTYDDKGNILSEKWEYEDLMEWDEINGTVIYNYDCWEWSEGHWEFNGVPTTSTSTKYPGWCEKIIYYEEDWPEDLNFRAQYDSDGYRQGMLKFTADGETEKWKQTTEYEYNNSEINNKLLLKIEDEILNPGYDYSYDCWQWACGRWVDTRANPFEECWHGVGPTCD